ncbi:glutamyl-tRNA amidotransferase [Dendryphion nanum]|uniref:Glutamyl-tRNA amidotransferase n=1 Tax=Dendryphion nanum TaxID=256645 RepID=A0A9P9IVT1_9PLEO|nr:glutamyl-tRNA amidotransferase [Dendryphion nanum]
MCLHYLWLSAISFIPEGHAKSTFTGATVSVDSVPIFIPPRPVALMRHNLFSGPLSNFFEENVFLPFTIVQPRKCGQTWISPSSEVETFEKRDDVWNTGFLQANIHSKTERLCIHGKNHTAAALGPLVVGMVFEAWRLYSDSNSAFTESIISNGDSSYSVLPAGITGQRLAIAVPSRLYHKKSEKKPLAGVRIGIKDIYDIKGVRTSNGNRAWYKLYEPAEYTATPVQNLIDAGAILVGKMLTSQFANGESDTADWVDYHESFNPRGDGYQDTSSSSSGSGAGIAAYHWLDVTLGSDTGGSVRGPAQRQGVYGNRPTHGIVELKHTMSLSPTLDTPGLLARDPVVWRETAKAMKLKTSGWPTTENSTADTLLVNFLGRLTKFLDWRRDNPSKAPLESLLNITYAIFISQEQIPKVRDPFYRDYAVKHDGWDYGEKSGATLEEAKANKTAFMSWFNSAVLPPNETTCSDSLLLYVGSEGSIQYRNTYLNSPIPPFGFDEVGISVFSEAPDFVVPIGETKYLSTVTLHDEHLPVSVNFMVARGCDGMLFSLIEALHEAGIVETAQAGRSGVTGGELFSRGVTVVY